MSYPPTIQATIKLPEDCKLEQTVIGACLAYPQMLDSILEICGPEDFYHAPHPAILEAIKAARGDNIAVTPLTIRGRLNGHPAMQECEADYLENLRMFSTATGNPELARTLVDMRLRRQGIIAAINAGETLSQPVSGIMEAMRPVLEAADNTASVLGKRQFVSIREAADQMLRNASDRAAGRGAVAASTGLKTLDDVIGGAQGGDLLVCAGRPGMGKTALLMTTAITTAKEGRPTLFFSLEMTQERLLQRIGCDLEYDTHATSPLSYSWFRNGTAKHEDIARMATALEQLPPTLTIYENGSLTIHEIASICRAAEARADCMGVIVIDYLQKVAASDRYRGNRVQEVTEISGAAKALAMRLKWPVIVGAQLNRGVEAKEDKRPNLTDLRESGSIEQDADAVIGLYRPAYYIEKEKPALGQADPKYQEWYQRWRPEKNRLDLLVMKNRNGSEDSLSVFCDMRASAIRDAPPWRAGA